LVLARHDLQRGRPDRALSVLERVTGAELDGVEFWSLLATALYDLRRWDDAVDAARAGLRRAPDDFVLLDVLALAELERGSRRRAREAIEEAIARYPENALLHAHRAHILARARRPFRRASYKKARSAVEEALRLDPRSEAALRVRARLAVLSRDRRALAYGSELLALNPEDDRAHVVTGAALTRRGDIGAAARHYAEAARLHAADPHTAWLARHARAWQNPLAAPLRVAHRVTRGRFAIFWVVAVLVANGQHRLWLTGVVLAAWVYIWGVQLYVRLRAGKAPK
jgi:tetratricopeptide (TPR) repeat protein